MTQEEKKAVIAQYLVGEGVMSKDEVEQHITMYAGQCPEATAAEKGLTTDIDKAYEVVLMRKRRKRKKRRKKREGEELHNKRQRYK